MKENKVVYIVVLLVFFANCCSAQKKLASDRPMQSFYSPKTQAYLNNKQPLPGAAATRPLLTSQKSKQELLAVSVPNNMRTVPHPNNNLTVEQKQRQLLSNTITMAQFSRQSLDKRNKKEARF